MIEGVDVSGYQGVVDWAQVAAAGKAFAFVKAIEGVTPAASYAQQWAGARAVRLRAAYAFVHAGFDGSEQAKRLLDRLNGDPGELPPIADVETLDGGPPQRCLDVVEAWIDVVAAYAGRPIVYVSPSFWARLPTNTVHERADLCVAAYGPASAPHVGLWPGAKFWQYSGSGACPGIRGAVDLDRWLGTVEELRAYAAGWRTNDARAAELAHAALDAERWAIATGDDPPTDLAIK